MGETGWPPGLGNSGRAWARRRDLMPPQPSSRPGRGPRRSVVQWVKLGALAVLALAPVPCARERKWWGARRGTILARTLPGRRGGGGWGPRPARPVGDDGGHLDQPGPAGPGLAHAGRPPGPDPLGGLGGGGALRGRRPHRRPRRAPG